MRTKRNNIWRTMWCAAVLAAGLICGRAAETGEPSVVWGEVTKAAEAATAPPVWPKGKPTEAERKEWREKQKAALLAAADLAKNYYVRFPKDPKAGEALKKENELLGVLFQTGEFSVGKRMTELETRMLRDPLMTEEASFKIRFGAAQRAGMTRMKEGWPVVRVEKETAAREVIKQYPNQPEAYELLVPVMANSDPEPARQLAQEIVTSRASEKARTAAQAVLEKLGAPAEIEAQPLEKAVGRPTALKFKAVDGTQVDLAKLKGKVVVIDFWATWCVPCVEAMPHLKSLYERLHARGLEVIGVSLDEDKEALEKYVAREKIPWPQYFDGKVWDNAMAEKFGIHALPSVWLVDKAGIVREVNVRVDLAGKLDKLLRE